MITYSCNNIIVSLLVKKNPDLADYGSARFQAAAWVTQKYRRR